MDRLAGKVALITGAARGLGAAMARRFRDEGATVVINDVNGSAAEAMAKSVQGMAIVADVADSASVEDMLSQVRERYQRLDILVNNAGISGLENDPESTQRRVDISMKQMEEYATTGVLTHFNDPTLETTDEQWQRMLDVHLNGTFFCTRAALRIMNEQKSGCIVNVSSILGTSGSGMAPAYASAKAGILGLTRAHAQECAQRGIRVNAIAPGWIDTDMTKPLGPLRDIIKMQTPLKHFGDVDDIAWAAVYLASDESKFITGQCISPNGGWYMSQ